jgi:hypothetical protein
VIPHLIALSRGEWHAAVEALQAAAEQEAEPHYRLNAHLERASALARLDPRRAGPEVAAAAADALADAERAGCRRCLTEVTLRGAEAMARIGRPDDAQQLLSRSKPADPDVRGFSSWWRSRALASLQLSSDHAVDATSSLEALAAEAERQGLLLEAVWARLDLGTLLASLDPKRAGQELRAAGATSPVRPAEPSGQPGRLVVALGGLAAALALVGALAVMTARRASRQDRARQAA